MRFLARILACAVLFVTPAFSQSVTTRASRWAPLTATGPTAAIDILGGDGAPPNYTIDAVVSGTAPTTCTFEIESSPNGTDFNQGAGSVSGTLDCHALGVTTTSVTAKPVSYLRINLLSLTGGDGTTKVTFYYTRGAGQ